MRIANALIGIALASLSTGAWAKCQAIGRHDPSVLNYICNSERGWAESVASGDPSTVKRVLSEDFIGVDPQGKQYRKAEMVADTAKAPQHFSSNVIGDIIVRFYGHSFICDERGDMLAEFGADETGVLVATLDLAQAKKHRAAFGFFRDRRPELYGRLVEDV